MGEKTVKADILAGFLVFLIALPLCLGISMAGGVPPISGVLTAIVGGMLVSFLGSARLTIKGPAAGLIVIVLGAVTELGQGNAADGYHKMLAVGVVAGLIQIVFALTRAGVVGSLMPSSVVHGMLAAIGVIIISKQVHTVLGVAPHAKDPLHLVAEIPHSIMSLNPEVMLIGLIGLIILFGMPRLPIRWIRKVPAPMVGLAMAIPLGFVFDLDHRHLYRWWSHNYEVGPKYLIQLPASLLASLAYPDFSSITSSVSIKYIIMFALVGSIESLMSVTAVDSLDPERRQSDLNRDLLATGVGNTIAALIGGTPMISEIVRSKANIDNGARSRSSNFFHGTFLLASLLLIPGVLQHIPLAALAAMLIYTGTRLASPKEFAHACHIGIEQLLVSVTTMMVTLATDLLVGVGVGLILELAIHIRNGAPLSRLFKTEIEEHRFGNRWRLTVHDSAIYTNFLGLQRKLARIPEAVNKVEVDFSKTWVVDHTVLHKLHTMADEWPVGRTMAIMGLENHEAMSAHQTAARRRRVAEPA